MAASSARSKLRPKATAADVDGAHACGEIDLSRELGAAERHTQAAPDRDGDDDAADSRAGGARAAGGLNSGRAPLDRPSALSCSSRNSERAWQASERSWRQNRQVAEELTVSRVVQRLDAQKLDVQRARQLSAMAAVRSSVQREADPGEWKKGERRWRHHQAQVESSMQARAAERVLHDQQNRLDAELTRARARDQLTERRRDEREAIRRHRTLAQETSQAASHALADDRRRQMAAFRAREKQRLATFEANVQRKRLGLPRLEADLPPQRPSWEDFGLSRVRPGTLPILAAAGGLNLSLSRPLSTGGPRSEPVRSRPQSRSRSAATLSHFFSH
ncbi:hypothetical protein KFE25_011495 [Diacronema lutheri]|uniref:Uncharacterized protein n=1 Tax=Diacronema lutheri TaxID=2081491 RepID=A0A8J5XFN3_DIALT|nr:hypothetical protein KFE25_011495 [Diacronema lutheri]